MPDIREEFEEWALINHYTPHHKGVEGEYLCGATAIAWEAWQASRAALKVELPFPIIVDEGAEFAFHAYDKDEMDKALQQAGIEVKQS